ncbi:SDR family NAD(P)-dependent oxidoreductase [Leucobacter sp. USCH14]|uniref:SDR family NAD(P)-dependent oxidoreductase n=1 Tax=Leucobacter sp. USCH14 TaxID=3024838 RepID=UPI0030A7A8AE
MRAVIVTGSAGGMGRAIVGRLQRRGLRVAGFDRTASPEADHSEIIDLTDPAGTAAAVSRASAALGPIDGFVSAAGHYVSTPFTDVTDADAALMLDVHLGAFFRVSQALLPGMMERKTGSIVAVASELAVGGGERDSHYAAAKGAVLGAVRSLAAEVAPAGIRVNGVAPGPTDTPMLPADSPWREPNYLRDLPTRALASPDDVARCVEFLICSGAFTTGETLHPNSGAVI